LLNGKGLAPDLFVATKISLPCGHILISSYEQLLDRLLIWSDRSNAEAKQRDAMNDSFVIRKRSRNVDAHSRRNGGRLFRDLELDIAEHVEFFQAFIREPASMGALSPSSRSLAKAMIQGFTLAAADTVIEMGPGTGAFTGLIRNKIGKRTTFIALELDPLHARSLRRRFPDITVYNDSAERMPDYLALHGKSKANYIVSGIPWANLPPGEQEKILDSVLTCLAPGGVFTTFAYVHARWFPKARGFRRSLEQHFTRVETSPVVWGNLPPAFVYRCSRSAADAAMKR
jgi:phosphatidylethanolamine/phosphatidyl-N-methylethanolamine N-methyltransferase